MQDFSRLRMPGASPIPAPRRTRTYIVEARRSRLREAFIEGRDRAPIDPDLSGREYGAVLDRWLAAILPTTDLPIIDAFKGEGSKALQTARRDELASARREYDRLWASLQTAPISAEGRLIVRALIEPGEAYLRYKSGDYCGARELLTDASAADHRLATEAGIAPMSAHRLQLGMNLLRIHTRLSERCEAIRLAADFLDYLEFRLDCLSTSLASRRVLLDSVPDSILEYYFDKFCGEMAEFTAGSNEAGTAEDFRRLALHTGTSGNCRTGFAVHGHRWLNMKALILKGELEMFLVAATDLLRLGRRAESPLWFGTTMELISACRSGGLEDEEMADWFESEASKLSDAPFRLRHRGC